MVEKFQCPSCGGGIDYDGHSSTMRCPYCNTSVVVPSSLRPAPAPTPRPEAARRRTPPSSPPPSKKSTPRSPATPPPAKPASGFSIVGLLITIGILLLIAGSAFAIAWYSDAANTADLPVATPIPEAPPPFAALNHAFGSEGTGAGSFEQSLNGVMDGEGRVYVADYPTPRIQVFESDGTFVTQWMLDAPSIRSLAVSSDGTLYVAYGGQIYMFNGQDGTALGMLRPSGTPVGSVLTDDPHYEEIVATPDGGLLAVGDSNVYRFNRDMEVTLEIPDAIETVTGNVQTGVDIVEDGLGNIYIAAHRENAIFKFNRNGIFQQRFGREGDEEGEVASYLKELAIDRQGRLYTTDLNGIQVFESTTGEWITGFNNVEPSLAIHDLNVSSRNELLVVSDTRILTFALPEE
jgi:hypothetical protein